MRPRLKGFARRRTAEGVSLSPDIGVEISIPDPQAQLLEDADAPTTLSKRQRERYFSNLAFFGTFADLTRSRHTFQDRLCRSRVLLLGCGGLGSSLLFHLAGLGVGHVTLADRDQVELKNLARQYLYGEEMVGQPKVECAARRISSFNSEMDLVPVQARIESSGDVAELLHDGTDLVLSAVDRPDQVQDWVNEACVMAGVPFVTGGFWRGRGVYYSVDPGRSGCRACYQGHIDRENPQEPYTVVERVNHGIAPVASLLASLVGLEAVRYLSGFTPPVSAGRLWMIDFVGSVLEVGYEWSRLTDCSVCGGVREGVRAGAGRPTA